MKRLLLLALILSCFSVRSFAADATIANAPGGAITTVPDAYRMPWENPGVQGYYITFQNFTNQILALMASQDYAQKMTNGFPWGVLYDAAGLAAGSTNITYLKVQGTNVLGAASTAGQILTSTGTGSAGWSNVPPATSAIYVFPATNGVTVSGTNVTIDMSQANAGSITLTTNAYIIATNSAPMRWYVLEVIQSAVLTNTVTFNTNYTLPTVWGQSLTMPTNNAQSRQFIYFQGRAVGNTNNFWQTLIP
jgi:hypothetical protein